MNCTATFNVKGMMCIENCARRVEAAALSVEGVLSANVNLDKSSLIITYNSEINPCERVAIAVERAGYGVTWDDGNKVLYFHVQGMTCQHCVKSVIKALSTIDGVKSADVSLEHHMATVVGDSKLDVSKVISTIQDIGYDIEIGEGSRDIRLEISGMVR